MVDYSALKAARVKELPQQALAAGRPPLEILDQALIPAMDVVGQKFSCAEFSIPEMLIAARAMQAGVALLMPPLAESGAKAVEDIRLMRATVGPSVTVKASGSVTGIDRVLALYDAGARGHRRCSPRPASRHHAVHPAVHSDLPGATSLPSLRTLSRTRTGGTPPPSRGWAVRSPGR